MHICRCSLVSLERYFVLIMFIVEKADSQLYVDPNMVKVCSATLIRQGKSVSGTVCSQKLAGSVPPKCSLSATFVCRSIISVCRDPSCAHLKVCITSFENTLTSLMRNGLWMNRRICCPRLKLSNLLLKFPMSLFMKSTKGETFLFPFHVLSPL